MTSLGPAGTLPHHWCCQTVWSGQRFPQPTAACHTLLVSSQMPHAHSPSTPSPILLLPLPCWPLQGWAQAAPGLGDVALAHLSPTAAPTSCCACPGSGEHCGVCGSGGLTPTRVPQAGEGTDCLQPCSHPLKGCSCLCSAAERDLGFFPLCDPLGVLVLTISEGCS